MKLGLDVHVPFSHQKDMCHWCGNSLARIRNIFKGLNCERYYCSVSHLASGEEAELLKRIKAAGEVS